MIDPAIDEKATQLARFASDTKIHALAMIVRTPREYEQVSAFLSQIKGKQKEIDGHRAYLKEPFLLGCRRVDEFFRAPLQFLKEAETEAKKKLLGYESEQKQIAAEEQRKLEEKARKEREALEAKARTAREKADREAAELRHKAEEARADNDIAASVLLASQANKIEEKSEKSRCRRIQGRPDRGTQSRSLHPTSGRSIHENSLENANFGRYAYSALISDSE